MDDEMQLAAADLRKSAVTTPVSMQSLSRLVLWGATAVTALLIAVIASRSVVGSQRAAVAAVTLNGGAASVQPTQPQSPGPLALQPIAPQDETRHLADDVRKLAVDNADVKARLAAVEQDVADVTGSIAKEAAAAKTAPQPTWPTGPVPVTPEAISAVVAPALPMPMEYGVDIGSGLSIQALRTRWGQIRTLHPQLFSGLAPTVALHETRRSNSPELRLVVGPLQSAEAATRLCAALQSSKTFCEPTIFAGQHLALD